MRSLEAPKEQVRLSNSKVEAGAFLSARFIQHSYQDTDQGRQVLIQESSREVEVVTATRNLICRFNRGNAQQEEQAPTVSFLPLNLVAGLVLVSAMHRD